MRVTSLSINLASVLKEWIFKGFILETSLILLILAATFAQKLLIAISPLISSDLFLFSRSLISLFRRTRSTKKNLGEIADYLGNISFYSLQVSYWLGILETFTVSAIPVIVPFLLSICIRNRTIDQCSSLSEFLRLTINTCKVTSLVFIGLKLDGMTDWSWEVALLPVWICLTFIFLLSTGILVLFLTSLYSGEAHRTELICLAWIFCILAGFAVTVAHFFYSLVSFGSLIFPSTLIAVFLFTLLAISVLKFKHLVDLCEFLNSPDRDQAEERTPSYVVKVSNNYYREVADDESTNCTSNKDFQDFGQMVGNCSICFAQKPNAVYMDCKHGGFCMDCALMTWSNKAKCPLCRKIISQVLEVQEDSENVFKVISFVKMVTD